jgi:hypothetical protein
MTAPEPPPRALVPAPPGSRLAELAARYAALKPAADEAAALLEEVKAAIKIELANAAPASEDITLQGDVPLRLRAKTSMRFDTSGFKTADPLTYARYTKQQTSWELREA